MSVFTRRGADDGHDDQDDSDGEENEVSGAALPAERGAPQVVGRRMRRMTGMVLGGAAGAVVLGLASLWGYTVFAGQESAEDKAVRARAKLRPGDGAVTVDASAPRPEPREPPSDDQAGFHAIAAAAHDALRPGTVAGAASAAAPGASASQPETPAERRARETAATLSRQITSPLTLTRGGGLGGGGAGRPDAGRALTAGESLQPPQAGATSGLDSMLRGTPSRTLRATLPPDRAWNLMSGTVAHCTVYTATDSTLPGLGKVLLASDLMSEDGNNVLAEANSEIIIEQRGGVRQGQDRVSLVVSRLITTKGVRVPIATPLSDELGRPGLGGDLNTHLWAKLKGAVILTGVQALGTLIGTAGTKGGSNNTNIVLSPQQAQSVISDVVRDGMQIQDTVTLPQAAQCSFIVFDDVDFSGVYRYAVR